MTPLYQKEKEALLWMLAEIAYRVTQKVSSPTEAVFILKAAGHKPKDIAKAVERVETQVFAGALTAPFSPLELLILQTCVEQSTWINQYRNGGATAGNQGFIDEALSALRTLAAKLEGFGIEITHIPFD